MTRTKNIPVASSHLGESNILSLPSVVGFCVPYCVWRAPSHLLIYVCLPGDVNPVSKRFLTMSSAAASSKMSNVADCQRKKYTSSLAGWFFLLL